MKTLILGAACMLWLATPVMAERLGEKSGVDSILGLSPTTADFISKAAMSDLFEIQSGQLAEQKSNGATKDFAAKMIADHTKTSDQLKAFVKDNDLKIAIPASLDKSHESMLDKLKGLNGNDFDKQYYADQDKGHKAAVSLFERYAKGGDNAKLQQWAATTLPTLENHYKMAEDLDK